MSEQAKFDKSCIRIGTITTTLAIIANFIPMIYLRVVKGIYVDFSTVVTIWSLAFAAFGVSWVMQPITYFPTLGIAGTYISWVVGSVADLRAPGAQMAQKAAGVEPATPQGDVMSVIGITSSVFVSVGMVTIFTLVGSKIIGVLPEVVVSSFTFILPAVFGAVYANMSMKNLDMGIGTFVSALIFIKVLRLFGVENGIITFVIVALGMVVGRISYVMKRKNNVTS